MYIGFAFWTLGLAILFDAAWVLLAVPIGLILTDGIVITREVKNATSSANSERNIPTTNAVSGAGSSG